MKTLQKLCVGGLLVLALALPTFAGHIPCGVIDPPPPPPQQAADATPPATDDEAGGVALALTILRGVLTVF